MEDQTIQVLLVEDDPDDAYLVRDILSLSGGSLTHFSVDGTRKLAEAVAKLGGKKFDVVLLDFSLPDSQGLETLLTLQREAAHLPIIVLTGLDDEGLAIEAVNKGAQDYLVKGTFDGPLLTKSIRYAIERSQLLHQLAASAEERFRNMIIKSAEGMVVIDQEKIIQFINPAAERFFGFVPHKMLGQHFTYDVNPLTIAEIKITHPREGSKTAEVRMTEIEWQGQPAHLIFVRDMTEHSRLEHLRTEITEHKHMDRLKDEFLSTVSHELRTPLAIVKGAVGNLYDGLVGAFDDKQRYYLGIANRNIDRLARLINDLLDLSRLESGRGIINIRRLDPVKLIDDTLQNFQVMAQKMHIVLEKAMASQAPFLLVDGDLLAQVMNNLLQNAMRFARTKIVVQVVPVENNPSSPGLQGQSRHFVCISVSDDGPGIPQEMWEGIFNKFIQLSRQETGEGYKGTGLGLAICKEIVERHQGKIWVESHLGQGACFNVLVPVYDKADDFWTNLCVMVDHAAAHGRPLSLLVMSVRNLGEIRRKLDRDGIDDIFRYVAARLEGSILPAKSHLFRYTLKDFMIVLEGKNREQGEEIFVKIKECLATDPRLCVQDSVTPRFDVGLASYPNDSLNPEALVAIAREGFVPDV